MIEGVVLTPLKILPGELGDVMHAFKKSDSTFTKFGEAYFSIVKKDCVKAWKMHKKMTLNLIVPCGEVKFVLYDDRKGSKTYKETNEIILSIENYQRLTIPPMIWVGFTGLSKSTNMLLNIADIEHDPSESVKQDPYKNNIPYKW
ncbi:MAG: dTDP-4-dehydrorhamnose 3,5-epimerase family protein [Candidatus Aenigmarchaeota archaeon]|nr:dTDP-4-dehydrorhamnose 3,5-epimerase family protein [Candidatus Aenigmarchaeota archaeon]